jgi:hypothetical protein
VLLYAKVSIPARDQRYEADHLSTQTRIRIPEKNTEQKQTRITADLPVRCRIFPEPRANSPPVSDILVPLLSLFHIPQALENVFG